MIVRARDRLEPTSREALAELYRIYWYPLYAYARRRGFDADAAADLIQAFFVELLDGPLFRTADPAKGRFRTYLLGALKHFISGHWERSRAAKRGGGVSPLSIDDAESRYGLEPAHDVTPERLFEHRWALTLLERVLEQLKQEYARVGKEKHFRQMQDLLAGPLPDRSYADIGGELGMSEGAVKVAVHRLRHRYRDILSEQIAETVDSASEVEDELRHLYAALSGIS